MLELLNAELLIDHGDVLHLSAGGAREPARGRGQQHGVRGEPPAPGPRLRLHGRHPHAAAAGAGAGSRARRRQSRDRQAQVPPGGGRGVGDRGHRAPLVARFPAPRRLCWPRDSCFQVRGGEDGDVSRVFVLVVNGVRRGVELHRL